MREKSKKNQNLKCYIFKNLRLLEYNWIRLCYFKKELNLIIIMNLKNKTEFKTFLENIFTLKFVWMELKRHFLMFFNVLFGKIF